MKLVKFVWALLWSPIHLTILLALWLALSLSHGTTTGASVFKAMIDAGNIRFTAIKLKKLADKAAG